MAGFLEISWQIGVSSFSGVSRALHLSQGARSKWLQLATTIVAPKPSMDTSNIISPSPTTSHVIGHGLCSQRAGQSISPFEERKGCRSGSMVLWSLKLNWFTPAVGTSTYPPNGAARRSKVHAYHVNLSQRGYTSGSWPFPRGRHSLRVRQNAVLSPASF